MALASEPGLIIEPGLLEGKVCATYPKASALLGQTLKKGGTLPAEKGS